MNFPSTFIGNVIGQIGNAFHHSILGGCISVILYPVFAVIGEIAPLVLDRNIRPVYETPQTPANAH